MSIFSPSNGKISKNLVDSIIGLSETIKKNQHVFKNIVSDIITETEAEKVKPEAEKVKPEVEKVKPLSSIISETETDKVKSSDKKSLPGQKQGSSYKQSPQQEQESSVQKKSPNAYRPRPRPRPRSRSTRSKYDSQTADMQQKYLKYKNKYLSLKQELGV